MNTLCVVVFAAVVAASSASLLAPGGSAIIVGPSGIVRAGVAPGAIAAGPLGLGLGLGLGLVPAGSGLEGQWIPDITEKLYDDGSYKPHVYGW